MFKTIFLSVCLLTFSLLSITGCGQKEGSAPKSDTSAPSRSSAGTSSLNLESAETSEGVTNQFLKAFFGGDDQKSFALLTSLAQKVTKNSFSASANDTIHWDVTSKKEQGSAADVYVSIRDLDETGNIVQEELVFHVSKEGSSWGVSGFSAGENIVSFEKTAEEPKAAPVQVSQNPSDKKLQ